MTTSSGIIKTARTNVYSVYSSDSRRTVPDEPFAAILSFRYAVTKRSNAESSSFYFLVIGKRPSSQLLSAMGPLAVISVQTLEMSPMRRTSRAMKMPWRGIIDWLQYEKVVGIRDKS